MRSILNEINNENLEKDGGMLISIDDFSSNLIKRHFRGEKKFVNVFELFNISKRTVKEMGDR